MPGFVGLGIAYCGQLGGNPCYLFCIFAVENGDYEMDKLPAVAGIYHCWLKICVQIISQCDLKHMVAVLL